MSPVPEMFPAPGRNEESHSLSSSLFSPPWPCLKTSSNTSAQSEDPALSQLYIPLCWCPHERPFYPIPQQLLSASKMSPATGNPVPPPSALNLTPSIPKKAGSPSAGAPVPSPGQPRGSQGSGPKQLVVGVKRICPYETTGSCWGKTSPAHRAGENLSKHLPLLHLSPPELLAEARTLLPFHLN